MTKDEALDLQRVVDEILERAFDERHDIGGAVNWGDLLCTDVSISLLDGLVTVLIEEAAPEAYELKEYVYNELIKAGFRDVSVATEW